MSNWTLALKVAAAGIATGVSLIAASSHPSAEGSPASGIPESNPPLVEPWKADDQERKDQSDRVRERCKQRIVTWWKHQHGYSQEFITEATWNRVIQAALEAWERYMSQYPDASLRAEDHIHWINADKASREEGLRCLKEICGSVLQMEFQGLDPFADEFQIRVSVPLAYCKVFSQPHHQEMLGPLGRGELAVPPGRVRSLQLNHGTVVRIWRIVDPDMKDPSKRQLLAEYHESQWELPEDISKSMHVVEVVSLYNGPA
jgi:hypothetical protein